MRVWLLFVSELRQEDCSFEVRLATGPPRGHEPKGLNPCMAPIRLTATKVQQYAYRLRQGGTAQRGTTTHRQRELEMRVKAVGVRSSDARAEVVHSASDLLQPDGLPAVVTRLHPAAERISMVYASRTRQGAMPFRGRVLSMHGFQPSARGLDLERRQQHNQGSSSPTTQQPASVNAHGPMGPVSFGVVETFSTLPPLFTGRGGCRPQLRPGLAFTDPLPGGQDTVLSGDNTTYKGTKHETLEQYRKGHSRA